MEPLTSVSQTSSVLVSTRASTSHFATRPSLAGSSSATMALRPSDRRPDTEQTRVRRSTTNEASLRPWRQAAKPKPKAETGDTLDKDFERLMHEELTFVGALDDFLTKNEEKAMKKSKALYSSWESSVFEVEQDAINARVDARSHQQVSNRSADLMDDFIRVSNSKPNGVFRDIVIEAEYDPLAAHKHAIRYRSKLHKDPCKLELRKHVPAASSSTPPKTGYARPGIRGEVPRLDSQWYDKLDTTPFGREGKLVPPANAPPYALQNRVSHDEYKLERDKELILREVPPGKRCFPNGRR